MAENRRRSETLTVRLTKAEKAAIITKSKKAKMTLTEYILAISKDTKIVLPPRHCADSFGTKTYRQQPKSDSSEGQFGCDLCRKSHRGNRKSK